MKKKYTKKAHNRTFLLFSEIKNSEQLRTRIDGGTLSVGNRYQLVKKFFTRERVDEQQIECELVYTNNGVHTMTVFV